MVARVITNLEGHVICPSTRYITMTTTLSQGDAFHADVLHEERLASIEVAAIQTNSKDCEQSKVDEEHPSTAVDENLTNNKEKEKERATEEPSQTFQKEKKHEPLTLQKTHYNGDENNEEECSDLIEIDSPNVAARSAMFEFLSDNMGNLNNDNLQDESSKLRSFEKLTSEVLKDSVDDRPLMAILKTNGWTGSRFQNTPTTALNPNALFLAFLNLHLSRKASKINQLKLSQKESLRNLINRGNSNKSGDVLNRQVSIIKNSRESISNVITDINDNDDDEDLYFEQIQSFCPNILLYHLS